MQQHDYDVKIHEEEYKFNKSKRVEVIPRYESVSLHYY
jgi:hypothetical protein